MKAVILAGGMGTRLRPVTYETPKPLVSVKKKPILNHMINLFARHGIREITVLAARSHEDDFRRWQKAWEDELDGKQVSISFEETPRGTFGGLGALRAWIGGEPFVLSNGDELMEFDVGKLVAFQREKDATAAIVLAEVDDPTQYGVPLMDGERITTFLEKPNPAPSSFVNAGLYVLDPRIFARADFEKPVIMVEKDIFPALAAKGELFGMKVTDCRWYDCGTLERWERAIKEW